MNRTNVPRPSLNRFGKHSFPRFVVAGGINTAVTYLLYLGLLNLLPYALAYTLTYLVGIVLAYALNASWVFRDAPDLRSVTLFPAAYLLNYLLGLACLGVLVERSGLPRPLAPLAVLALSVPIMYAINRWIFSKPRSS